MNGLMVGFEDSKQQKVELFSGYLHQKYRQTNKIKFTPETVQGELSK